jgi:hypothetical protein
MGRAVTIDELVDELAALKEGWDGEVAPPIGEGALDVVRYLNVVPTVNGGVAVEINTIRWEISLAFDSDGDLLSSLVDRP